MNWKKGPCLAAFLFAGASLASASTIQFVGVPTGVNDGAYYDLPYQITIDGVPELVACYDIYDDVNFGDVWQANLLTLNQAAASGYFSSVNSALAAYEEVAWLDAQPYQTTAQQIGLQYAIWSVFGTAPSTTASISYQQQAAAAAALGYQGFDFSSVRFIEQIGGVSGQPSTKQAFVYWSSPPVQRAAQQGIASIPEPRSAWLALLGLATLTAFERARRTRRAFAKGDHSPPRPEALSL